MGFVQEVVEPGQRLRRAEELAQTVAARRLLAVRATLTAARLAFTEGEKAAVKRLIPDLQPLLQSEDIKEGIQSFNERRQAHFQGKWSPRSAVVPSLRLQVRPRGFPFVYCYPKANLFDVRPK